MQMFVSTYQTILRHLALFITSASRIRFFIRIQPNALKVYRYLNCIDLLYTTYITLYKVYNFRIRCKVTVIYKYTLKLLKLASIMKIIIKLLNLF